MIASSDLRVQWWRYWIWALLSRLGPGVGPCGFIQQISSDHASLVGAGCGAIALLAPQDRESSAATLLGAVFDHNLCSPAARESLGMGRGLTVN